MAGMRRSFNQRDVRIREQSRAIFGQEANKGIVESLKDQRWNRDAIDYASAGSTVVVVIRIAKAKVARNDLVIKSAQRANDGPTRSLIE